MAFSSDPTIIPQQAIPPKTHGIVLIGIVLISIISSFSAGLLVATMIKNEKQKPNENQLIPTPAHTNQTSPINRLPVYSGNVYFSDTIVAMTKTEPRKAFIATVTRKGTAPVIQQEIRSSYFDGNAWNRKSLIKQTISPNITPVGMLVDWKLDIDPSRVLKETASGKIMIDETEVSFQSSILTNEISMRSLPGYTKFMSKGTGKISVNGTSEDAYLVYTKIYSMDAQDIQFYNSPFDLRTDWLIFWDDNNNFYHIDATYVGEPTVIYQTHQVGVLVTSDGFVGKTFEVTSSHDADKDPSKVSFTLGAPIQGTLTINRENLLNKAPNNSYNWIMGTVTGEVSRTGGNTTGGFGLYEYIYN